MRGNARAKEKRIGEDKSHATQGKRPRLESPPTPNTYYKPRGLWRTDPKRGEGHGLTRQHLDTGG